MIDVHMFGIAVMLGVIEGLTEFLPVSSTGHLIVASSLVGFGGRRAEVFQIFIQLGAILAVVWEFRSRLLRVAIDLPRSAGARAFTAKLFLAFLPFALAGLALHDVVVEKLFAPVPVATALIAGAALILLIEALPLEPRTHVAESLSWLQALGIGFAQCLALWPGFSRAAATILGGMTVGLDRRCATEFSFFLAIPTMFAATVYSLYESSDALEAGDATWLALAFVIAFVVAWAAVRWLLRYIANHDFRVFAWYRTALGLAILLLLGR